MKKQNKRIIFYFLLLINIFMLVIPAIPHHHHANGTICMKHDMPVNDGCPSHHNHNNETDPCCTDNCLTRFDSSTPSMQPDQVPHYVFIAVLFNDLLTNEWFKVQEQRIESYLLYQESLHGTNIPRTFGLRAPPSDYTYKA